MATTKGSLAQAADFNTLRQKIINEFTNTGRRTNSVTGYRAPVGARTAGDSMLADNVNNIAHDLYIINSTRYLTDGVSAGTPISLNLMETLINEYAGIDTQATNSGCGSACMGLCSTGCYSGCKGTCKGTCQSGCSNSCAENCSYTCATAGCSSLCKGTCVQMCADACANSGY